MLLAVTAATFGAAAGPGAKPEWADLFGDAPLPVVWQSMTAAAARAAAALGAPKLDGVADMAETIHLGAHALSDQVQDADAEKKKRLTAALTQAAKIADELLDAAQHGEPDVAKEALRRINAALALARSRLPQEITAAAPATPRFAKAPKHDDHAH